jgi:hypothetical protein
LLPNRHGRAALLAALIAVAIVGGGATSPPTSGAQQGPPIVLVVFDALPPLLLQDNSRHVDPVRFPNFAGFADGATWYRNATTIHESTRFSVPAIFDGRTPRPHQRSTFADHPYTVFDLLAGRYRMNVWEEATELCRPALCGPHGSTNVLHRLTRGRDARFRAAVRRYQLAGTPDTAIDGAGSNHRRFLQEQSLQRDLLQLEFTDTLVKVLVDRLKSQGIYDDALVAFISDHGESFDTKTTPAKPFQLGELSFRRAVTPHNIEDVAGVALFVKYPGQTEGRIDDRFARTVDLFPTIAAAAGVRPKPGLAGQDLRSPSYSDHGDVAVQKQDGRIVAMPAARWRTRVDASKARELALFGFGSQSLFDFGPARSLYGKRAQDLALRRVPVALYRAGDYEHVQLRRSYLPVHLIGRAKRPVAGKTLAFAINGTVVASAPGSPTSGTKTRFNFSVMLPPEALDEGRNRIEAFEAP